MQSVEHTDWIVLLSIHYKYIEIFEKNDKYKYKAFGILPKNNTFALTFDIININEQENESRENYRIDPIFNQEPKLLKEG